MMRILVIALLTVVIPAVSALAQTPPPTQTPPPVQTPPALPAVPAPPVPVPFPGDVKIGFVNFQTLVDSSVLGQEGMVKLQTLADAKQVEMAGKDVQIQTLQNEIQTQSSVLAPAALAQKNADLQRLQGEMTLLQQNAQSEYELLQGQLLDEFESKALPLIEAIREERGLWFILAIQDGGGLAVVAAMPGINLTADVAKRMDELPGSGG